MHLWLHILTEKECKLGSTFTQENKQKSIAKKNIVTLKIHFEVNYQNNKCTLELNVNWFENSARHKSQMVHIPIYLTST